MSAPKLENGHIFNFDTEKCENCGMTREHYEDNGKPTCKVKRAG
jgi:hypothetical protein